MTKAQVVLFFFLSTISIPLFADEIRLDLRYLSETTRDNLIDETIVYRRPLLSWLNGEVGVRVSESLISLRTLEYKAEVEWPIFSFLSARVRLANVSYIPEGAGSTNLLFLIRSEIAPVSWFAVHFGFGWSERFLSITSISLPFTFSRTFPDHDFAIDFGMRFQVSNRLAFSGSLATFEVINTFNLHNPFAQIVVEYLPDAKPWKVFGYVRDRLLLGFGRRDELTLGIGYQIPL